MRLLLAACLALGPIGPPACPGAEAPTRWTMLPVTPADGQADCHLIDFPDGRRVLIDAADAWDAPGAAVAALRAAHCDHLALVVISHFHRDHYGRLLDLLDAGITIDRVAVNVPDRSAADREIPWGCDYGHVQSVLASLRERHVPYFTPAAGDRLIAVPGGSGTLAGLDVLCLYDGLHTPIGPTDVNDTSIILRLFHGATRVLFTGDLNRPLGTYLAQSGLDLRAGILKAPHHGTEGCAPDEFFDRVGATAWLVPAPRALWASARSLRMRRYCTDHHVATFVSGVDGRVTVTLTTAGYSIEKER